MCTFFLGVGWSWSSTLMFQKIVSENLFFTKTMTSVRSNNLSLKYQRFTTLGLKNIGIRKSEFVAKNQLLCHKKLGPPPNRFSRLDVYWIQKDWRTMTSYIDKRTAKYTTIYICDDILIFISLKSCNLFFKITNSLLILFFCSRLIFLAL